ncbi:hypothetical protein IOLA_194 [uncultured bacterium]|nr:hypothetical protein IOLA_194 [uncultured bacterium]
MPMISPNDIFICMLGSNLKAIPIPNNVNTNMLSPMTMTNLAFIGLGVCPVTGIPTPCVPAIVSWLLPSKKLIIKTPALMHGMSMAICARGGMIKAIPISKPPIIITG